MSFRKYYTDEDVIKYAAEVKSMGQLLSKLDLKQAGGNFANMKRKLQQLEVDTSHWGGQSWNRGQQLKDWSKYTSVTSLKRHLIKDRSYKCESCLNTEWLYSTITLEVHHIDGNRGNNELNNLQLLCPNCHSQTDNWRRQK